MIVYTQLNHKITISMVMKLKSHIVVTCKWKKEEKKSNIIIQAMFVSQNSLFGKSLSKLSCVCLLLGKLVNGKHFPVNGNTFRSTENTFQSKKNLVWFPEKYFSFWLCLFSGKWFPGNHFPNFPVFVCHQKSWSTENTFQSNKNLAWFSRKYFPEKFGRKTLSGSCEKFRNVIIC